MLKLGGWLGGGGNKAQGQTRSLTALDELAQIEDAMAAVTCIMNDDVDTAEAQLGKGSSPFHQLGIGVVTFVRATLGFEQDVMREASEALSKAENAAYEHQRRASRTPHSYQSPIYPPGTEYAVCLAEAQLMSAIVGVLNESLTEAIKSFYKLRKAYITLEGVLDAEKNYLKERSTSSLNSTTSEGLLRPASRGSAVASTTSLTKESTDEKNAVKGDTEKKDDQSEGKDEPVPVDVKEERKRPEGLVDKRGSVELDSMERNLHIKSSSTPTLPSEETKLESGVPDTTEDLEHLTLSNTIKSGEDVSLFGDHPVDMFIISGSNFCFGILLLIISLVPPAFATLLKIVGFKGDRERGIQMLWQATKFHNIHGALAGLVLFGYYNGLGFCDIIPLSGEGSYPKAQCKLLLTEMRKRYPKSHLWLVEEARTLASEKELEKAVDFIADTDETPLKQLEALAWFERSLNTMFMHDYEGTSDAFLKCITLNNWSHGLYYFICGASYIELYRRNKKSNPALAKEHADKAVDFFKKVAPNTGKKRFMARQLPFDIFVNRKIQKWEARAKEWGCELVDAVGVSPIEEMIYFWNGYKRMRPDHLDVSLQNLAWSESSENPYWEKEGLDEKGILSLLRAAALRSKGETAKAKEILQEEIISHEKMLFKGHLKDAWTAPCARYEMAANVWREAEVDGKPEEHMDMLEQCKKWLVEVSAWESYDLDARTGMKVTTAKGTLRRYGLEC